MAKKELTKREHLNSEKKLQSSQEPPISSDIEMASQGILLIRKQTENALSDYDRSRRELAEKTGDAVPESLNEIWREACRQQDTNEMLRTNLMQLQVLFQEVYQKLFEAINTSDGQMAVLIDDLQQKNNLASFNAVKDLKVLMQKERSEAIKNIESLAKTIKQVQAEYRQGEMSKAQFYHISEVKASQMFIIAILKQMINDQSLLNNISDALFAGWTHMGSFTKIEDTNGKND